MLGSNKIIAMNVSDIRFPTSDFLHGSDATNKDPDYSATYVAIKTELGDMGYGLIFTMLAATQQAVWRVLTICSPFMMRSKILVYLICARWMTRG